MALRECLFQWGGCISSGTKRMFVSMQNDLTAKWNTQLLTMRCCIIEGKKFSILPNREKGKYLYNVGAKFGGCMNHLS